MCGLLKRRCAFHIPSPPLFPMRHNLIKCATLLLRRMPSILRACELKQTFFSRPRKINSMKSWCCWGRPLLHLRLMRLVAKVKPRGFPTSLGSQK